VCVRGGSSAAKKLDEVCMRARLCVCERECGREGEGERERGREGEGMCVCGGSSAAKKWD
jgi:hypothetical protein